MSCTPNRNCQQQAKMHEDHAAVEAVYAPLTPGLPEFGALTGERENSPATQDEGRQEVAEMDDEPAPEITHHLDEEGGAQSACSSEGSRKGLSGEEKERVAMLMSYGYSLRQAAARVERAHTTVSRQLKKDPEFAAQLERYRSYAESDALGEVVKASRKSWRAAAWLLTYLQRRDQIESTDMAT